MVITIPDEISNKLEYAKIQLALYALQLFNGNGEKAYKYLGISRRSLRNYIYRYDELILYRYEVTYGDSKR
jgi:hypothetical protein